MSEKVTIEDLKPNTVAAVNLFGKTVVLAIHTKQDKFYVYMIEKDGTIFIKDEPIEVNSRTMSNCIRALADTLVVMGELKIQEWVDNAEKDKENSELESLH